ncbi:MAG: hypothetical protein J5780_04530 [Treponema sp.]|nr:hypothetical protein [Treponema sp.]
MEEKLESGFVPVSIEDFFDKDDSSAKIETGIVFLTPHQQNLINRLMEALKINAPEKIEWLQSRLSKIENLAKATAAFPSLLERTNTSSSVRTPEGLVETLVSYHEDGDMMLHMPSKATLGKGFLVTKIHTFYSLSKLAKTAAKMDEKAVKEYTDETNAMLFTLMAEDVYLNLLRNKNVSMELRRTIANALIILWEHRSDQTMDDIAPVLQTVWNARRKLAPAFGTMMGSSELIMINMEMDEQWLRFTRDTLSDPEINQAMEEFLFGISYEQILRLKEIIKTEKDVKSISRDEVSIYLGERVKTDISLDYRDFYLLYTIRRDNARARQRLHLPGPKNTLEDYFILYAMEKSLEKQKKDRAAII